MIRYLSLITLSLLATTGIVEAVKDPTDITKEVVEKRKARLQAGIKAVEDKSGKEVKHASVLVLDKNLNSMTTVLKDIEVTKEKIASAKYEKIKKGQETQLEGLTRRLAKLNAEYVTHRDILANAALLKRKVDQVVAATTPQTSPRVITVTPGTVGAGSGSGSEVNSPQTSPRVTTVTTGTGGTGSGSEVNSPLTSPRVSMGAPKILSIQTLSPLASPKAGIKPSALENFELKYTGFAQNVENLANGSTRITTDNNNNASYQFESTRFRVKPGDILRLSYDVKVEKGIISFGFLTTHRNNWFGEELLLKEGDHKGVYERKVPADETEASLVLRNYHLGVPDFSIVTVNKVKIEKE
jgi:hypothetical protein